ncbi:MAG: CinA family nicotinamide mononucleotide deamidase-related protein [Oleispira sp.]
MTPTNTQNKPLNIQFLLTGTELMVGDIIDTNSVMLAQSLKEHGAELTRKVTLGDDFDGLVAEIEHMSRHADVLLINGGLGPTEDDLTAEALAKVIEQPLEENTEALVHLEGWCEKRGFRLEGANRKQILLPRGIQIVANPVGSAVGFSVTHNNCQIICTPGVPVELKQMWQQEILPQLKSILPNLDKVKTVKLHTFGIGESAIQNIFNSKLADWPKEIEVGYRAASPLVELKLTTRSEQAEKILPLWQMKLEPLLGAHILHFSDTEQPASIAKCVVDLLVENNQTLTTAESCTGGLIASNVTRIPGSSAVFEAGFVTYSNRIKTELLGVEEKTLNTHGAVSEAVVLEMARGALNASGSDWAVAVSGIAGPGGGSEEKPVGTVWICWGSIEKLQTKCLVYPTNRLNFQRFIANAGLDLIRREILEIKDAPSYFSRTGK